MYPCINYNRVIIFFCGAPCFFINFVVDTGSHVACMLTFTRYKYYTRGVQHFNQHEIVLYHVVFILSITTLRTCSTC